MRQYSNYCFLWRLIMFHFNSMVWSIQSQGLPKIAFCKNRQSSKYPCEINIKHPTYYLALCTFVVNHFNILVLLLFRSLWETTRLMAEGTSQWTAQLEDMNHPHCLSHCLDQQVCKQVGGSAIQQHQNNTCYSIFYVQSKIRKRLAWTFPLHCLTVETEVFAPIVFEVSIRPSIIFHRWTFEVYVIQIFCRHVLYKEKKKTKKLLK